ncbi:MAG: TonB-dependent receptor [Undibacterium sp.]|uniref:TonB-dependent receptor plug domain-containing protein n=1 Tax=Undibacterium sp. TaxID=1914977 RepID=UPI002719E6E7|nr:TonB-dependent receptor [Undibacterium sp.]MDO8651049.1 TonB-dependent receptor [Undibacterium sp.]
MMVEKILSRSVRLMFVGGVAMGAGLLTQQAWAQEANTEAPQVQRVEITGSSIKRVAAETALPVTIMKKADIERTGATTAQDLVNLIPSNFGGQVLANNVGQVGAPSTANLRGIGQNYTLVLLNGRRVSNYALGNNPVDLNSIPLSAIERVEVLRDGASALYGADAIAGVINFILRTDYQGIEASVNKSKPSEHGGDSSSYNVLAGYGNLATQGFNVMISANHENDAALKSVDRSFAATGIRPDLGIAHTSPRGAIPNLTFSDSMGNNYGDAINPANPIVGPSVNPNRYLNCNASGYAMANAGATTCQTDYVKYIDLIPKSTHDNVIARGVLQLNESHQIYAEIAQTKDHIDAAYSPAPYAGQPPGIPNLSYPTSGRFYPTTVILPKGMTLPAGYIMPSGTVLVADTVLAADMAVTPNSAMSGRWRTVAGGGRHDLTDITNQRLLLGAKGTFAGWDYDTALTSSKNEGIVSFGSGQYSFAKLSPLLNSGQINIYGQQDAASLAALQSAQISGLENSAVSKATTADFRISKEIVQTTYGPVGLALGVSARKESLDQVSSDILASGDQVGGNGPVPGVSSGRKVYGMFAESSIPLYKDLELNAAVRYDNYKNDFGTSFSNVSPKLALRYQPSKEIVLRASVGQGFRAPTLYDNLYPFTAGGATANNWSDPVRCPGGHPISSPNTVGAVVDECNVQLTVAQVGNKDLKPEKSKQFSIGIVFQPTTSFSGSLDYWDVRINDVIQYPAESQIINNPTQYASSYYRFDPVADPTQLHPIKGSTNPDFPLAYILEQKTNFAKNFAAGLDLNLNYKQKVAEFGAFGLNLDGTLTTKHGYQYPTGASVSDLGVYHDFGVSPRWRHALTATFNRNKWNASVTHNYTTSYQDYTDPALSGGTNYPAVRDVSAYSTFDVTLGWTGIKNLDIGLGVKNLFDKDPPSTRAASGSGFQVGYDSTLANPLGRVFYVRAKYKFL